MGKMKDLLIEQSEIFNKYHPDYSLNNSMDYIMNNHNISYWKNYRKEIEGCISSWPKIIVSRSEDGATWAVNMITAYINLSSKLRNLYLDSQILVEMTKNGFILYHSPSIPPKAIGELDDVCTTIRVLHVV